MGGKKSVSEIIIAAIFIVFALLLSNVFFSEKNDTAEPVGMLATPSTAYPSHNSLQIHTLYLITATPIPSVSPNAEGNNCTAQPTSVTQIKHDLLTNFGVTLFENSSSPTTALQRAALTYKGICMLVQSQVFKKALFTPGSSDPVGIYWNDANWCAYNNATHKNSGNLCQSHGVNEDCINLGAKSCPQLTDQINLVSIGHELGHVLNWRRPDLFAKWCHDVYNGVISGWECISGSPHAIPTYSCLYDYGIGPYGSECWADMLGEYLNYKNVRVLPWYPAPGQIMSFSTTKGRVTDTLHTDFKEFPTMFADYYNWTRDTIWGGVTF